MSDCVCVCVRNVMMRWLQEQGELHGHYGDVGAPDRSTLPPDVASIVSMIMQPYSVGAKGRCVLGLLLR